MLNFRRHAIRNFGMIIAVLGALCNGCDSARAQKDSTAPANVAGQKTALEGKAETAEGATQPRGDAATQQVPTAEGSPEPGKTPELAAEADQTAKTCKDATAKLAIGDLSALKSLPAGKEKVFLQEAAAKALECFAIADDSSRYCDLLPEPRKARCAQQWQIVREIKDLPKELVKYQIVYQFCVPNAPKALCDKVREAWTSRNPAKCGEISEVRYRDFCAGLATDDVAKCRGISEVPLREYCVALVTEDANRCPKEAPDCPSEMRGYAKLKKEGLDAFLESFNPTAVAALKGKKGCKPFLTDLERLCVETN